MGTISHHQTKAREFLQRADRALSDHDPTEAAVTLRRAAAHATTALAVKAGWKHKSRHQLETVLHAAISSDVISRSHLKTFRQAHAMTARVPARGEPPTAAHGQPPPARPRRAKPPAHPELVEGCHPAPVELCPTTLRRMRRRVASLIKAALAIIAGQPKPVQYTKRWQRDPNLPMAPNFTCTQDIMQLPNYDAIRERFNLSHVALEAKPDPHGWYSRGDTPRRCPCHADLWDKWEKSQNRHRVTLAPPWRQALEKTFRIKLPDNLQLAC